MTQDILAVIAAPTIAGLAAVVSSLLNKRAIKQVKGDVQELHVLVNSNLSKWIGLSVAEALARGTAEGIAQERARTESVILLSPTMRAAIASGIAEGIEKAKREEGILRLPTGAPPTGLIDRES